MKLKKSVRPLLEALEDRSVPSVTIVDDASGNLSITGDIPGTPAPPTLTIVQTAPQTVTVTTSDGEFTGTPFTVLGNITANVQFDAPTGVIQTTLLTSTSGNVSLTGSSAGTVTVNVDSNGANSIAGSLTINTGAGADTVNVNSTGLSTDTMTINGPLTVNTGSGNDSVSVATVAPTTVNGNVSLQNVNQLTAGTAAVALNVAGFSSVSLDAVPATTNHATFSGTGILGGGLSLTGSAGADSVALNTTIQRTTTLSLGNGNDSVTTGATAVFNGSFTVVDGSGADSFAMNAATQLSGNLSLNYGNGNDTLTVAGTISGSSITINEGAGTDSVTYSATAPGARLSAYLAGGGNDTFHLGAGGSYFSAYINLGYNGHFISDETVPPNTTIRHY